MNRSLIYTVFAFLLVGIVACQKEEYRSGSINLQFSVRDTICFDTIFTTIGSATRRMKVYNRYDEPVKINSIRLAKGNLGFRMNVDGEPTKNARNVKIAAKDSIYIFVEVTVDPLKDNPMLVQDSIVFEANGSIQDVDLIAFGRDVHLINNKTLETTTWGNDKPYLIYNTAKVKQKQKL